MASALQIGVCRGDSVCKLAVCQGDSVRKVGFVGVLMLGELILEKAGNTGGRLCPNCCTEGYRLKGQNGIWAVESKENTTA